MSPLNVVANVSETLDAVLPFLRKLAAQIPKYIEHMLVYLKHASVLQICLGATLSYLVLVRALRWRRYNAMHKKYEKKWDNGRGQITPQEAQEIIQVSTMYDMPMLLNYSLAFALFKTYAIPSISKLLLATKELGTPENVARRYADTEILIATWVGCPITGFLDPEFASKNLQQEHLQPAEDPRAMIALARVNWIHSRYRISNNDYIYTLCLFILEPARWAEKYGWRPLSSLEKHSFYVLWAEIARKMDMHDIPESFLEAEVWSRQYEESCMVPAESNKTIAELTLGELLYAAPEALGLKAFGRKVSVCLLEEKVREGMMQPQQPWSLHLLVKLVLGTNIFAQKWLMLPRSQSQPRYPVDIRLPKVKEGQCLRMFPNKYASTPWYRPESRALGKLWDKFLVSVGWFGEMPAPHLKSKGYRLEEMGPIKFEHSGLEEVMKKAAEMQNCPITGDWSLEGRKED